MTANPGAPTSEGTRADAVRADDRAHVFHSWSAQELIDPLPIARVQGLVLLG